MKKIFFSLALAVSMMASAQVFEVGQLTKLNTPTDTDVKVAGVSADGSYVLITNGSNHGLRRYDVATGRPLLSPMHQVQVTMFKSAMTVKRSFIVRPSLTNKVCARMTLSV